MNVIESMLTLATSAGGDGSIFGPLFEWFEIDDPWEKWLVLFGLLK